MTSNDNIAVLFTFNIEVSLIIEILLQLSGKQRMSHCRACYQPAAFSQNGNELIISFDTTERIKVTAALVALVIDHGPTLLLR